MQYFEEYSEIKKLKPTNLRGPLRNVSLSILSRVDKLSNAHAQLLKPRVQFIYVHHVFKDEEQQLHNLLNTLQKHHTFISYSEAVEKILTCTIDKPYIVFSSDDGFKNNVRAAEILLEYNARACFFINPALIGEISFKVIEQHCKSKLHLPPIEFLNWDDVNNMLRMGHEIGSHTMEHINIAATHTSNVVEDMHRSYEVLKAKCGNVKHFAFPYGRFIHFNEVGRRACFDAGYTSCATAERGCHINHDRVLENEELCILRDHVILDWDIDHVLYFLTRNARKAKPSSNLFPLSLLK